MTEVIYVLPVIENSPKRLSMKPSLLQIFLRKSMISTPAFGTD
jgi:hypothetical protein